MGPAAAVALVTQIVTNLPAVVQSGAQVIKLVNDAWNQLNEAVGDREVSPQEVEDLVKRIVANSAQIQAL